MADDALAVGPFELISMMFGDGEVLGTHPIPDCDALDAAFVSDLATQTNAMDDMEWRPAFVDFTTTGKVSLPGLSVLGACLENDGRPGRLVAIANFDVLDFGRLAIRFPANSDGTFARLSARLKANADLTIDVEDAQFSGTIQGDIGSMRFNADGIQLCLGMVSCGAFVDPAFRGLYLENCTLTFPPSLQGLLPETATLKNATIGTGGLSGSFYLSYAKEKAPDLKIDPKTGTYPGPGSGKVFGIPFSVTEIDLRIQQNAFLSCGITGRMRLPFFDCDVNVCVGLGQDGGYLVKYIPDTDAAKNTLSNPFADITIDSFGIKGGGAADARLLVSGTITPTVLKSAIDWPTLVVRELSIDRHGNVEFKGGWADLDKPRLIGIGGVGLEVTQMGIGRDPDGCPWVGLNGALKLPEGVPASASVEGLKVRPTMVKGEAVWTSPRVEFSGIGVEFEIPDVLRFEGKVAYREDGNQSDFRGGVRLDLFALDMTVEGQVVFGSKKGMPYFAIYLACDLPTPFPLFGSGLAIYGLSGLAAVNYAPDRKPETPWYALDHNDWFHKPKPGVADLLGKWAPKQGAFAIGLGAELGTETDSGYAFNGKFLAVVALPGPVILLEGTANICRERATKKKPSEIKAEKAKPPEDKPAEAAKQPKDPEPMFHALAALDTNAGTLTCGLDAHWRYKDDGQLLDILGSSEVFVDLHDASRFHFWLGRKSPESQRVRAKILGLFEANAYLELDGKGVRTGAKAFWSKSWSYKVADVGASIHISTDVEMSWQPPQFQGSASLGGEGHVYICKHGISLSLSSTLAVAVPQPFLVKGDLAVAVEVWPFGSFSKTLGFEWKAANGQPAPKVFEPPPRVVPLTAVTVGHALTGETWPLLPGRWLLPGGLADARGYLVDTQPAAMTNSQPPPSDCPVVPLDVYVDLEFARPVADVANAGADAKPVGPDYVGDPKTGPKTDYLEYGLQSVELQRWKLGSGFWETVAAKPKGAAAVPLWGAWGADLGDPAAANRRLRLWGVDGLALVASPSQELLAGAAPSGKGPRALGNVLSAPVVGLENDSWYRLRVATKVTRVFDPPGAELPPTTDGAVLVQCACFRTESGPGRANLSLPPAAVQADLLTDDAGNAIDVLGKTTTVPVKRSPLNSLAPYTLRALPAVGDRPDGPTTVWRGADLGADFRSSGIAKLYRGRGQDLQVRVRDRAGKRVPVAPTAGNAVRSSWLSPAPLDPGDAATQAKAAEIVKAFTELGVVLSEADVASGARLRGPVGLLPPSLDVAAEVVPALLAQPFDVATPGVPLGWAVVDAANAVGKGEWAVLPEVGGTACLRQTGDGGPVGGTNVANPAGTALVWQGKGGPPPVWADVELAVRIRTGATGAIGVELRRADAEHAVRVVFDRDAGVVRAVAVQGGKVTVLAQRRCWLAAQAWHDLTVRAVGNRLEVACAGDALFTCDLPETATKLAGTVALWCTNNPAASFAALVVADLSPGGLPLLTQPFQTSAFASPAHLASLAPSRARRPDKALAALDKADHDTLLAALAQAGMAKFEALTQPSIAEDAAARTVLAIAAKAWDGLRGPPEALELALVALPNMPPFLVVRSPVNLDWRRSTLALRAVSGIGTFPAEPANGVRIVGAEWPIDGDRRLQAVYLVAQRAMDLHGAELTARAFDAPDVAPLSPKPVLDWPVGRPSPAGLLWHETFAAYAVDLWRQSPTGSPQWSSKDGVFLGSAGGGGQSLLRQPAVACANTYTVVKLLPKAGKCGIAVRLDGAGSHYRVEFDAAAATVCVVSSVVAPDGKVTEMAEPAQALPTQLTGKPRLVEVWCTGSDLFALVDGATAVRLAGVSQRGDGFGLWIGAGGKAEVTEVVVFSRPGSLLANALALTDLSGCAFDNAAGLPTGASEWKLAKPAAAIAQWQVSQSKALPVVLPNGQASSTLTLPVEAVADFLWIGRLQLGAQGGIGLSFGRRDGSDNFAVRFKLDKWALSAHSPDGAQLLVTEPLTVSSDVWHPVAVRATADAVSVWLDGVKLCDRQVPRDTRGGLALECLSGSTKFEHVALVDLTARAGPWHLTEAQTGSEALQQRPLPLAAWAVNGQGLELRPIASSAGALPHVMALAADPQLPAFDLRATCRPAGKPFGVVFGWIDACNYAWVWVTGKEIQVSRLVAGKTKPLGDATAWPGALEGEDLAVQLVVTDAAIAFTIGKTTVLRDNPGIGAGSVGFTADPGAPFLASRCALTPAAQLAIRLDALPAGAAPWTFIDPPKANGGPSHWHAGPGDLVRQTGNTYGGPDTADNVWRPGAVALRSLAAPVTDFLLTCDLQGGKEDDDEDALGAVFRWRNSTTFYRFAMDHERKHRRLVRVVNGEATVLWSDGVAYEPGRWYRLAIVAKGPWLRGWLDGVPLFAVCDTGIGNGDLGLYTWAHTNAHFRRFGVFALPWHDPSVVVELPLTAGKAVPELALSDTKGAWAWAADGLVCQTAGLATATLDPGSDGEFRLSVMLHAVDTTGSVALAVCQTASERLLVRLGPANAVQLLRQSAGKLGSYADAEQLTAGTVPQAVGQWRMLTVAVYAGGVAVWVGGQLVARLAVNTPKGAIALVVQDAKVTLRHLAIERMRPRRLARFGPLAAWEGRQLYIVPGSDVGTATTDLATVPGDLPPHWPAPGPARLELAGRDGSMLHRAWAYPGSSDATHLASEQLRTRDGGLAILRRKDAGGMADGLRLRWTWRAVTAGLADLPVVGEESDFDSDTEV